MGSSGKLAAGVDTHKRFHALAVLDGRGRKVAEGVFPADAAGYDELARAIGPAEGCEVVGVEGTSSYGAGLAQRLSELGYEVVEVLRPGRPGRRAGERKDDLSDAERAARQARSGHGCSTPKARGCWVERLRCLEVARESLVRQATVQVNVAKSLVQTAPEPMRERLSALRGAAFMAGLAGEVGACGPDEAAVAEALRALAAAYSAARSGADALEASMAELLRENAPALLEMRGCGTVAAAKLAVAAGGNPERLRGEAAFAALCGASPVECSSGEHSKRRLNRGGDRQANRALTVIVNSRIRTDPRTKAYMRRRVGEGKTKREAKRCLKRYVAREAYRAIMNPAGSGPAPDGAALRAARASLGMTQSAVASMLGVSQSKVSAVERGADCTPEVARLYAGLVEKLKSGQI